MPRLTINFVVDTIGEGGQICSAGEIWSRAQCRAHMHLVSEGGC